MNTIYTVLGIITFYSIIAYVAYEYVWPYVRAIVDAFRFIAWYDREAKKENPNHKYTVGPFKLYGFAYRQELRHYKERRAGISREVTHHSGAVWKS